jgi:hypothetical protein
MARYAKFFSLGAGGGGTNNLQLPVGTILDATLRQVQDGTGTGSPLYLSTLRVGITSDSSVTTQTSSVIQATTTDANLVIAPNGGGALISQIPDGTTAGGRIAANAVASGTNSGIFSGFSNRASGSSSNVGGGDYNAAIGGYAHIGGGINNTASSDFSTVLGGQSNTASTGTHATVVGGESNTASGNRSIAGGYSNTASGAKSIALGDGSISSGVGAITLGVGSSTATFSTLLGGRFNRAGSDYCIVLGGIQSQAYLRNQLVANSNSGTTDWSDNQLSQLSAYRYPTLTTGATATLSLDGTGTTNLIIPNGNNRLWAVKVVATAFVSVAGGTLVLGDSYMGEFTLLFKRVGGTSSVVGVNAGNIIYDTNMATAAFTFAAGASQDLQITFKAPTTASATTFRCVAKVELVEVAY